MAKITFNNGDTLYCEEDRFDILNDIVRIRQNYSSESFIELIFQRIPDIDTKRGTIHIRVDSIRSVED